MQKNEFKFMIEKLITTISVTYGIKRSGLAEIHKSLEVRISKVEY